MAKRVPSSRARIARVLRSTVAGPALVAMLASPATWADDRVAPDPVRAEVVASDLQWNAWSSATPGAYRRVEIIEDRGVRPHRTETRETRLERLSTDGTAETSTRVWRDGLRVAEIPARVAARNPARHAVEPVRVTTVQLDIDGHELQCEKRTHRGVDPLEREVAVTLWHCPRLNLFRRTMPQWMSRAEWQLPPDVAKGRIAVTPLEGDARLVVDLEVVELSDGVEVGDRELDCVVEELVFTRRDADGTSHLETRSRRWIHPEVPGLEVRAVVDDWPRIVRRTVDYGLDARR